MEGLESNDGNPNLRLPFEGPLGATGGVNEGPGGGVDSIIGVSLGVAVVSGGVTMGPGASLSPLSVVGSSGARTVD